MHDMYEREIYEVLERVGRGGLRVKQIARYVCNEAQSLFEPVSYADVYRHVSLYLRREASKPHSQIERARDWGCYRLRRQHIVPDTPPETACEQPMLPFAE